MLNCGGKRRGKPDMAIGLKRDRLLRDDRGEAIAPVRMDSRNNSASDDLF